MELGLEQGGAGDGGPLEIVASCSQHLWEALCHAYRVLGLDAATDGDEVFARSVDTTPPNGKPWLDLETYFGAKATVTCLSITQRATT